MIGPVIGGSFEGPKIKGEVLSGADWILFRSDGVGEIDVRATLRADDGKLIYCHYRGILNVAPELFERALNGEDVDPSEYYFRTTPVFETASEKYGWLNKVVTVGTGLVSNEGVEYDVYSIL